MDEKSNAFAKAMAQLQSVLDHVKRDTKAYNYMYATLDQCWNTIKKPLTDNGFSIIQLPYNEDERIGIHTVLLHESGEKMESKIAMPPMEKEVRDKTLGDVIVYNDPQSIGSLLTYLRRYSLMAIIGICPADDDAKAATPSQGIHKKKVTNSGPQKVDRSTSDKPQKVSTYPRDVYGICLHCDGWIINSKSNKLYCENHHNEGKDKCPNAGKWDWPLSKNKPKLPEEIRAGNNAKEEARKWFKEKNEAKQPDRQDIPF